MNSPNSVSIVESSFGPVAGVAPPQLAPSSCVAAAVGGPVGTLVCRQDGSIKAKSWGQRFENIGTFQFW